MFGTEAPESPESELVELLTCHRTAARLQAETFVGYTRMLWSPKFCYTPDRDIQLATACKEADGPFPWQVCQQASADLHAAHNLEPSSKTSLAAKQFSQPRSRGSKPATDGAADNPKITSPLSSLRSQCQALGLPIDFRVCKKSLMAGSVLEHAHHVMEAYFGKHSPLIFKIGWTHCPIWRWTNSLYGYQHSRDLWQGLVILHASHEPFGPAMLEAALINTFQSN